MENFLKLAKKLNRLKVIDKPLDVELEIPHVAYLEIKKEKPDVLLFTNPVDGKTGYRYSIPVVMNAFAGFDITQEIFGKHPDRIAEEIEKILHMKPPQSVKEKLSMLGLLLRLKNILPKRLKREGISQQVKIKHVDLSKLPVLKTWEKDGGRFITAGQVYTKSIDGKMQNLGLYRLQVVSKDEILMHWQIHKDASHFFDQYHRANKKMPVTIAIGGDPLYTWCGQAPLPYGLFEILLYGFIRNKSPRLVKSLTNDIYFPEDVDIVIEGEVDPQDFRPEGPFGDHTGYYTPVENFPVMKVKTITMKKNPYYYATVVGKPPVEDKYMGWATERIFLPLLRTTTPDLIDYHMPENGVFHNLILAKIKPLYKGHAKQIMHTFWGVGQMSFVKHAIFVDDSAPDLTDYIKITEHILNRLSEKSFLITEGIVDQLDHASYEPLVGGKLGVDVTGTPVEKTVNTISDTQLFEKIKDVDKDIVELKQYMTHTSNPVTVIKLRKTKPAKEVFEKLKKFKEFLKIVIFVDENSNDLNNPYMLVWRVTNNIDALKDIWIEDIWGVDATAKSEIDGYHREWPEDVFCTKSVIEKLKKEGIIDVDTSFLKKYQIIDF
ncbi:4-hydroxy-3-polyprenylbenzoate decarboxylase [Persephonella hydrogeniphila]|uniref:4-hydroxy-3-polyprenylbenzoate decarboxylase n=1 Tax=Persephonella hydrogeniphila TaxID=198703 RepID=A0A285N373_9AQUI|nr:menaquinone biosynthesis decarboxylase [Persephonella hydrogeniphila]SNZ03277.1 4-hydroxy-3-polyprenylbenzoate decarboxylase [Persephonella hydrogeniphila]